MHKNVAKPASMALTQLLANSAVEAANSGPRNVKEYQRKVKPGDDMVTTSHLKPGNHCRPGGDEDEIDTHQKPGPPGSVPSVSILGEPARNNDRPIRTSMASDARCRTDSVVAPRVIRTTPWIKYAFRYSAANDITSVAQLTFGPRVRLVSQPNVRCQSYTRTIGLLVCFMVLTFALDIAARDSDCQNRNTNPASGGSSRSFSIISSLSKLWHRPTHQD